MAINRRSLMFCLLGWLKKESDVICLFLHLLESSCRSMKRGVLPDELAVKWVELFKMVVCVCLIHAWFGWFTDCLVNSDKRFGTKNDRELRVAIFWQP